MIDRGLDLLHADHTSDEELEAFRAFYLERYGFVFPAFDFWLENDPSVLKRYRLQAAASVSTPVTSLGMLHFYAVQAYEDGILYEVRNARAWGATKAQVLETLATAFIHAGPWGMRFVATAVQDELRTYEPTGQAMEFPDGWAPDPKSLQAGLDYSLAELASGEAELIARWYEKTIGEVPRWVEFMATHRPGVLKAYRARIENSIGLALPKQVLPWLMVQLNTARGFREGIREWALIGSAFGMTTDQIVDAVTWGVGYNGGAEAASIAADALRDT